MQTLPIIISVFCSAAAIIAVLFWRIKPQPAVDVEPLNKRIAEEAQKSQGLQAKVELNEAALRAAEANAAAAKATMEAAISKASEAERRFEAVRSEYNTLQTNFNQVQPSVATAIAEREAANKAREELSHRLADGEAAFVALQADYNELKPRTSKAIAEKDAAEAAKKEIEERLSALTQKNNDLQGHYNIAIEQASASKADADHLRIQIGDMSRALETYELNLAEERQKLGIALAKQQSDEDATRQFENISHAILKETMAEAKQGLEELAQSLQKSSGIELEKHADKVARTLEPLQIKLQAYDEAVESLKKGSQEAYGSLTNQIAELQKAERLLHQEAKALTTALSSNPKVKGMYGELLLRQLVEFVGMQQQCHFEEQASRHTEEGRRIPDLLIFLPGGQKVIVDAKAVMNACVEAYQCQDETQRGILLKKHCDNVRARVIELSGKKYFSAHVDAVESVVLFLPAENLYSAAIENDPELTEFAMKQNIIICGPNSLMMLLKVANQLWRRASIEEEAQKIKDCGDGIYKFACDFVEKYAQLGIKIRQLEKDYNDAAGTLDGRLIPRGREMGKLTAMANGRVMENIPKLKDDIHEYRSAEAKKQIAAAMQKLPGLTTGEYETAEIAFAPED